MVSAGRNLVACAALLGDPKPKEHPPPPTTPKTYTGVIIFISI